MEETKIRHFFEYLDYENLTQEDNSFERPVKNEKGIFVAKLNTPFAFYLPKSELCDMFQDTYGNNVINYVINLDSHSEIVQFLENFDTLCINHASDNSRLWFGKELNSEKLIKYYNTLYELSQDEKALYLPIAVGTENIEEIIKYNENSDIILSVKIVGIEFFQQTFRWQIQFNKIVDSIDESDNEDDMNFDELVQGTNIESLDNYFEERHSDIEDNTIGIFNYNNEPNSIQSKMNQYNSIEKINTSLESNKLIAKTTNNQSKIHTENLQYSPEEELYKSQDNNDEYEENYEQNISNDNEYIVNNKYHRSQDGKDNEQRDYRDYNYQDVEHREEENQYDEDEHEYDGEEEYENNGEEEYENNGEEEYENNGEEEYENYDEEQNQGGEQNELEEQYYQENDEEEEHEGEKQYSQENNEESKIDDTQGSENRYNSSREEVENIENETEETHIKNEEYENELNKSIINELAEDVVEHSDNDRENHQDIIKERDYIIEKRQTAAQNYEDVNNEPNLSNDTIQEITSIISEKKIEAKKYTINASRARRALDTLSHKADEVNKEIELYETKLRACQSSN